MRVTLAMPVVDSVPGEAVAYHMMLAAKIARTAEISIPVIMNVFPHDRARNQLFEIAQRNESDYIFFVDDDMVIPPDAYCRLLEVFSYRKPRPVAVSGHYYRRGWPYTPVWSVDKPGERGPDDMPYHVVTADSGVHQIHFSGLGCCLIDVHWVTQNLVKPYFFMRSDDYGTNVTDDVTFFEAVQKAGGVVYGNADVRCGHLSSRQLICDRTAADYRKHEIELREDEGLPPLPIISDLHK